VNGQKCELMDENWDLLIILDACRYDFFKKVYKKYLVDGTLKKAKSPGLNTMDWLNKVFKKKYKDITYISSNPYINSKKRVKTKADSSFDAKMHFKKIIDVWLFSWDDCVGSVLPDAVTAAAINSRATRKIIHYIQPHNPYVGPTYSKYFTKSGEYNLTKRKTTLTLRNRLSQMISNLFGINFIFFIAKALKLPATSQTINIAKSEGIDGLRAAYLENLELVLKSLTKVVNANKTKRILITADHGEYLGEYGKLGHNTPLRRWPITDVPWLTIN